MREKFHSQRKTGFLCQNRETHGETVRLDRYGYMSYLSCHSFSQLVRFSYVFLFTAVPYHDVNDSFYIAANSFFNMYYLSIS